jgi:hypothetical protein
MLGRLEAQRASEQQPGPSRSLQDLLAQLEVGAFKSQNSTILWTMISA